MQFIMLETESGAVCILGATKLHLQLQILIFNWQKTINLGKCKMFGYVHTL